MERATIVAVYAYAISTGQDGLQDKGPVILSVALCHIVDDGNLGLFISYTGTREGVYSPVKFHPTGDSGPWRKHGLFTIILTIAQQLVANYGLPPTVYLQSCCDNTDFYSKLGFEPVGKENWLVHPLLDVSQDIDIEFVNMRLNMVINSNGIAAHTLCLTSTSHPRMCCIDAGFNATSCTHLHQFDVLVFQHTDAFEVGQGAFVAHCIACNTTSDKMCHSLFVESGYYKFASTHIL